VTGKHRAVLSALRDAQHAHEGEPVSAGEIAAVCSGPWHRRSDLVAQALWLLHAQGLVLSSAGAAGGWKITATGRAELPPRRGPARGRRLIGGAHRGPTRPR
jgi:predicted transcriptional regulator